MEFQEVMRQFDRMCWYYQRKRKCPMECPMNGVNISQCRKIAFEEPDVTEKTVMSWVAEHPEPVYPTWGEWFAERGDLIKLWRNIRVCSAHGAGVIGFLYTTIPADIAQKLGIEPKEGI